MVKETISSLSKKIEELVLENKKLKEENKELKKVNKKKRKDLNEPKKVLSAYNIFYKEELDKYKEQNPDKKIVITKIHQDLDLSKKWEDIKKNDKKYSYYVKKHEEDKVRYQKQLESYKSVE